MLIFIWAFKGTNTCSVHSLEIYQTIPEFYASLLWDQIRDKDLGPVVQSQIKVILGQREL